MFLVSLVLAFNKLIIHSREKRVHIKQRENVTWECGARAVEAQSSESLMCSKVTFEVPFIIHECLLLVPSLCP